MRGEPDVDAWAASWREAADLVSQGGEALTKWLSSAADQAGRMRYGVPTSEKERLAASGSLPGAPQDQSADQGAANRYASGYLFGQAHPTLAPMVQPAVDMLKTSDLPGIGGESPEAQSYASHGVAMSRQPTPGSLAGLGYGRR